MKGCWSSVSSVVNVSLHRLAQTRERKFLHFQCRDEVCGAATLQTNCFRHQFNVLQHCDRTFIEAEILDRISNLSILDPKYAIAGEAREQHRFRINITDIPKAGNENSLVRRCD